MEKAGECGLSSKFHCQQRVVARMRDVLAILASSLLVSPALRKSVDNFDGMEQVLTTARV